METPNDERCQSAPCFWVLLTLGSVELRGAPPPPTMMSHAAWSLLAYLATTTPHQLVARDRLQHELFDEVNQGSHMLRNAIYVLRKWLGDAIVVTRSHLALASHVHVAVDSLLFLRETAPHTSPAQRMRALARYGGQFLVRPLYGWALETAQRIHERYLNTLQAMVDYDISHGRSRWSLAYAEMHVNERNWDHASHERYIRLLAMHGQLYSARQHIAVARKSIDAVEAEWIERMERVVEYARQYTFVDQQQLVNERLDHMPQIPLHSRIVMADQLELLWNYHVSGHAQFVVLQGAGGSGKTQLLTDFQLQRLHVRTVWLKRAASTLENDSVLTRLLALIAHDPAMRNEVERIYATLSPAQQQSLDQRAVIATKNLVNDANIPYQLRYDALINGLIRFVANQPLLLVVDDASIDLIEELLVFARRVPKLMIIVMTEEHPDCAATITLSMPSLTPFDVKTVIDRVLMQSADDVIVRDVHANVTSLAHMRTYIQHLCATQQLRWSVTSETWEYHPQDVPITMTLPVLSPTARQLVQLLAVIDDTIEIHHIVVKPWRYRRRIHQAMHILETHQLIERMGDRVRIASTMIRHQVLDALSREERAELHRWAMQSTQGIAKATHALVIGDYAVAYQTLLDVADTAWKLGDVRLLRQAYRIMHQLPQTDPDMQWMCAVNAVRMARFGEEPERVRHAVTLLQQLSGHSSQRQYEALIGAGVSLRWAGYPRESIAILQRVYHDAHSRRLPRLVFAALHALTFAYLDCGDVSQSLTLLTKLYAPKTSVISQVIVALTQSYVYARIANYELAERAFHRVQRYHGVLTMRSSALVRYHAGVMAFAQHQHVETVTHLTHVMTVMFDIGDMVTHLMAGSILCLEYVRNGRFAEAEHLAPTILERATSLQLLRQRLMALFGYMHVMAHQQRWPEAYQLASDALHDARAAGLLDYEATLVAFMLRAAMTMNQHKAHALMQFMEVHQRMHDPYAMTWYHELAWFYLNEGNKTEALRWALFAESHAHTQTVGAILPVAVFAMVAHVLQRCNHRQYLTTRNRAIELLIAHLRTLRTAKMRLDVIRGNRGMHELVGVPSMTSGDVVVLLPINDAPRGRRLRDDEYVPVIWSGAVLRNQHVSLIEKIQHLTDDADAQGATVMIRDLAKVLFVHERTILRAVAQAADQGVIIRTYRPRRSVSA